MPWLSAVLPSAAASEPSSAPANISLETQRAVIRETKRAWSLAEQVRSRLNELLSEFLVSSTLRQQLAIISSAQKLIDLAISGYIGENSSSSEDSVVANVRTNLAAEVILEAGHYIAVMEENLKADHRGEPPIRTRIDRTDGEVRAVSQGFQSAEEVRQVFAYFRGQVEKAAAEQPKLKSPRRQRSAEHRKESAPQDSAATVKVTAVSYLGIALSAMLAAVLLFAFAPTWLRIRLAKLMPDRRKAIENMSVIEEELLQAGPKKEKGGRRKRGNSAKTSAAPLISLIDDEPPSVEFEHPMQESDVLEEPSISCTARPSEEPAPSIPDPSSSESQPEDFNLSSFLMEEQFDETGEWISASHAKPSRLKRSLSNTAETNPRQQQTKRQITQYHLKEPKSRANGSSGERTRVDKSAKNYPTSSKHQGTEKKRESAVCAEQPPASSDQRAYDRVAPEHPRTPSPSDVREVQSPTKGPFDHINVKWMAPPLGSTTNTRIIPDEEISDCSESSYSHSSPNEVTHDLEQVTMSTQHFPVMIPVPVYYVPAPMNFNQMHDQQGHMLPVPFIPPPFDYYHGMHLPPQPVPDHIALLNAVRAQIEYYFSTENLCRDMYLRGMMDAQGYVKLAEICKFNRIRSFGAPPLMILEAVASSNVVSLLESPAVCVAKGNYDLLSRLQESEILESKIRPSVNPEIWPKRNSISASRNSKDQ